MILKKISSSPLLSLTLSLTLTALLIAGLVPLFATASSTSIDVWWPTEGAHMQDVQPFKAMIPGLDVSQYNMFWQVDNGQWNSMSDNYTGYQHKEADVDLTNWTWHGSGPYVVNFIAQQGSTIIAQQSETIYVDNGLPTYTPPAPTSSGTSATTSSSAASTTPSTSSSASSTQPVIITATPSTVSTSQTTNNSNTNTNNNTVTITTTNTNTNTNTNTSASSVVISTPSPWQTLTQPVSQMSLYVSPDSDAATQASQWASNPTNAAAMQLLADQSTAVWFGNWNSNVENDVHTLVSAAEASSSVPVLVAYNIPQRDCGSFSAGGSDNPAGYTSWINSFAQGLGNAPAYIILEPDALAEMSCLSASDQATRLQLLSGAVTALKQDTNAKVYIDAGHANWIDPTTMAADLQKANVAAANGFSLNVSNFDATNEEVQYGQEISSQLGGKHFVVDTSRNGNGSDNAQWCNPSGMAIGQKPTTQTGNSLVDAYLWIKVPGESDGTCNGGPSAGVWWPSYALQLVQNAH